MWKDLAQTLKGSYKEPKGLFSNGAQRQHARDAPATTEEISSCLPRVPSAPLLPVDAHGPSALLQKAPTPASQVHALVTDGTTFEQAQLGISLHPDDHKGQGAIVTIAPCPLWSSGCRLMPSCSRCCCSPWAGHHVGREQARRSKG
jgi:hypothetical protein